MDAFLKRIQQKTRPVASHLFAPGTVTCVYGRPGIGKTYMVENELPGAVRVDHTILKSKNTTIDFFERLGYTDAPVIIDEWESLSDLIGVREITGPISKGPLVIITHEPVKLTSTTILYEMPIMSASEIEKLAPNHPCAAQRAVECKGDVRSFLRSLTHTSDTPDTFKTPRQVVTDLITSPHPDHYLSHTLHEHGYVWSMIQENYIDTKGLTLGTMSDIADSMSLADMYDTTIYADGAWDTLMPYFVLHGCVLPCHLMKRKLNDARLRSGSLWTKFQNACMRKKKMSETKLGYYELLVIRKYIENGQYDLLDEYKLDTSAVDVMNHIVIGQKLKPKVVDQAKKHVRVREG